MKYYRKPHYYKKKKPFFRKRFLVYGFLALLIISGIFYGLFLWKIFWADTIIIEGEQKVAGENIEFIARNRLENKALFFKTNSIFCINTQQIEKDILAFFPQITQVQVKKKFFNTISVRVEERTGVALWCQEKNCFLVDKDGIIFEESSSPTELIAIESSQIINEIVLGKKVIDENTLAEIIKINSRVAQIPKISLEKVVLVSEERLNVDTGEGWSIYFNLKGDLEWQVKELALVLEKQISAEKRKNLEYIDLRFSRVYYK